MRDDRHDTANTARTGMAPEEGVLAILLIALGLIRIIPAIVLRQPIGSEPTIALLGFVAGMWWGLRWRRMRRAARRES